MSVPPLLASEPDLRESLAPFWERLQQTIAWCAPRTDPTRPKECYRSPELRPRVLHPSYRAAVQDVGVSRGLYLGRALGRLSMPVSKGRLLVFGPDEELSDGAAEAETDGYFDVNNTPPWDTWIAFIEEPGASYLLSWVAPHFIEPVARGIDVNPEGCIRWLDEAQDPYARWLAEMVEDQRQ